MQSFSFSILQWDQTHTHMVKLSTFEHVLVYFKLNMLKIKIIEDE